ncbi:NUDIX domain-containing protein [Thiomicrospira microaerophila]|uniref:NUDIX domain-containing protein n=1 Tax=Thiomicrospira microaerophila TaxID=406020 RepID=UPI00200FF1A1|nr:NUDIX domain-containing protein [Thiomicrospira microaerophila]UQB43388.1 NUDIX domain-containing protein [Thiomicrospira microaerophila]
MKDKKLVIHAKHRGYDGFFKINLIEFQHSLYQGGLSPKITRELFGRGQAVVVLLYDLAAQQIVLVEQCRAGALQHALDANDPNQAWLIEPVAGMIDDGETPLETCQRETREEAGIEVSQFEYINQFYPSPGGSDEILHLYAAEIDSSRIGQWSGLAEEVEDIRLVKIPFDQAKQQLLNGEYHVASTLIALQWLFFQKLQAS